MVYLRRFFARIVGTIKHLSMRAKHEKGNGYFTTIATKISLADKVKLNVIAERFGMTYYQLNQALLLAIVRYFDKDSAISYESNTMLNAFGNVIMATNGSFCPLNRKDREQQKVKSALLLVERKANQRPQLLAVTKDDRDGLTESYNLDKMLADFMEAYDPEILNALKDEQKRLGYFSIGHTLHELVLQKATPPADTMGEEITEMFQDMRITSGQKTNKNVFYQQKQNRYSEDYSTFNFKKKPCRAD